MRCIDEQFAIEAEDARQAGTLGYMTRALVLATMPYKDPKADVFTRVNGDFKLRILAGGRPMGSTRACLCHGWLPRRCATNRRSSGWATPCANSCEMF